MNKRKRQQLARRKQRQADIQASIADKILQRNFHSCKTLTKSDLHRKKNRLRLQEMADMSSPPKDYSHEESTHKQSEKVAFFYDYKEK